MMLAHRDLLLLFNGAIFHSPNTFREFSGIFKFSTTDPFSPRYTHVRLENMFNIHDQDATVNRNPLRRKKIEGLFQYIRLNFKTAYPNQKVHRSLSFFSTQVCKMFVLDSRSARVYYKLELKYSTYHCHPLLIQQEYHTYSPPQYKTR